MNRTRVAKATRTRDTQANDAEAAWLKLTVCLEAVESKTDTAEWEKDLAIKVWDQLKSVEAELQFLEDVLNQCGAMKVKLTEKFSKLEVTTLEGKGNSFSLSFYFTRRY